MRQIFYLRLGPGVSEAPTSGWQQDLKALKCGSEHNSLVCTTHDTVFGSMPTPQPRPRSEGITRFPKATVSRGRCGDAESHT